MIDDWGFLIEEVDVPPQAGQPHFLGAWPRFSPSIWARPSIGSAKRINIEIHFVSRLPPHECVHLRRCSFDGILFDYGARIALQAVRPRARHYRT